MSERWHVTAALEPARDAKTGAPLDGIEDVVVIIRAKTWLAKVAGDSRGVTRLEVTALDGATLSPRLVMSLPVVRIRQILEDVHHTVGRSVSESRESIVDTVAKISYTSTMSAAPTQQLSMEEFLDEWWQVQDLERYDENGRPLVWNRRELLAERLGRSVSSVDMWIRKARDLGEIPPSGRKLKGEK